MSGKDMTVESFPSETPATFRRRFPTLKGPIGISPSGSSPSSDEEAPPTTPSQRVAALGRLYEGPDNRGRLGRNRRQWEKIGLGALTAGIFATIAGAFVSNRVKPTSEGKTTPEGWQNVEVPKPISVESGNTILGLAPRYLGHLSVDELRKQVYQTSGMGINPDGSVNMNTAEGELIPGVQIAFPSKTLSVVHLGVRTAKPAKTAAGEIINDEDGKPTYSGGDIPGLPSKFKEIDDTNPDNPLVVLVDDTKLPIGFGFSAPNHKPARIALRLKDQSLNQKSGDRLVIQIKT